MAFEVRSTTHVIGGQTITFAVLAPTANDETTRRIAVTDPSGGTVELYFEHDDFQLFKSILKEF